MKYYLAINGQQTGPFERNELLSKGMTADSLVWAENMSDWTKASKVPELAMLLGSGTFQPAQPQPQSYSSAETQYQPQQPYGQQAQQQQQYQQQQPYQQQPYQQQQYGQQPYQQPYAQQQPQYAPQQTYQQPQYAPRQPYQQQYAQPQQQENTTGTVGFWLTITSVVLCLIPYVGILTLLTGPISLILCIIGVSKKPNSLAKAGIWIHVVCWILAILIFILIFVGVIGTAAYLDRAGFFN